MEKNSKNGMIRIPRPYGATSLSIEYHKTKDISIHKQFTDLMVNQWLLGNGSICGKIYDIQTFALSLGIDVNDIRVCMRNRVLETRIWDKENQESILQGLIGQMVSWTLEDRLKINRQIDMLTQSQDGKYKPFISSELNKALKLGLESTTSMQSLVQKFMGGGGTTNIFNLFQQNNTQENTEVYVTKEQVLEIINDGNKLSSNEETLKLLESNYDLKALPEVVATKQEGVDTSKEGIEGHVNAQELSMITDNLKLAMESSEHSHHEMRRQIEENIDNDSDDPELYPYEEDYDDDDDDDGSFSARSFLNS